MSETEIFFLINKINNGYGYLDRDRQYRTIKMQENVEEIRDLLLSVSDPNIT